MVLVTEEQEQEQFDQMQLMNNMKDTEPVEVYGDVLSMTKEQDVRIFGKTFHVSNGKKNESASSNKFFLFVDQDIEEQRGSIIGQRQEFEKIARLKMDAENKDDEDNKDDGETKDDEDASEDSEE